MKKNWSGEERRKKVDASDHDLLIEINANLINHARLMSEHMIDDTKNFMDMNNDIKDLQRDRWIMAGGIMVGIFVMHVFFKY